MLFKHNDNAGDAFHYSLPISVFDVETVIQLSTFVDNGVGILDIFIGRSEYDKLGRCSSLLNKCSCDGIWAAISRQILR